MAIVLLLAINILAFQKIISGIVPNEDSQMNNHFEIYGRV